MRCALIEAEKANYAIAWMCRQLAVPRSSFYAWRSAADTVTATAARRQVLAELVAKVFEDSRGSTSLVADVRPSSTSRPSTCWKIKYNSRSDTAEILPSRW
jgi:hypothetical protein